MVILDLEDAVLADRKTVARDTAERALAAWSPMPDRATRAQVRLNAMGTPWSDDDVAMVSRLPGQVGVRLPKCEDPRQVAHAAEQVGDRAVHVLIESARGVEAAYDLARAHPRVASIALGEADLRADLGVVADTGLMWARSRVVVAAAAAGLDAPAMSVYADVRDLDGLRDSCLLGKSLGFVGRTAIHPVQLPVIRAAFIPDEEELARAHEVVAAAAAGAEIGRGAVALADGRFVDEAVVRQARRLLALARGADS